MPSIFDPLAPRDVRRAALALLAVSALSLAYASLYGNVYQFRSPLGTGLPDASAGAETVLAVLGVAAVLGGLWAVLLALASTPSTAQRARALWHRLVAAEQRRAWAWLAAAALAGLYAALRVAYNSECSPATLADLTAGTAQTPFQYRTLVPWTVRAVVTAAPALGGSLWLLYGLAEAAAALAAWIGFRRWLRPTVTTPAARSVVALVLFLPLALNLATPFRHNALFFGWDTLSVALFTGGLALLQERRWAAYYLLFAVATLNRETTCFLTIAWVLSHAGRVSLRHLAAHGAAQLAVWLAVKGALAMVYAGNTPLHEQSELGGLFITPYVLNLGAVSTVPGLLMLASAMGGLWLVPALLHRRIEAPDLRRWFRVVPVFVVAMLIVGEALEVRIYSELIPLVTTALIVVGRSVVSEAAGAVTAGAVSVPGRSREARRRLHRPAVASPVPVTVG